MQRGMRCCYRNAGRQCVPHCHAHGALCSTLAPCMEPLKWAALTASAWLAGIDRAARDMTQMQRSSKQIQRALERVKIIQRGAGTLVSPCASHMPLQAVSTCCYRAPLKGHACQDSGVPKARISVARHQQHFTAGLYGRCQSWTQITLIDPQATGISMQALESLLNNYKARHVECLHGSELPRKYILVEMWDAYAGLGNQFPSVITGAQRSALPCLLVLKAA